MVKKTKPKYKPLMWSTTLRNPERIGDFLSAIVDYDGFICNTEVVMEIYKKLYNNKTYRPKNALTYLNLTQEFEEGTLTEKQLEDIVDYVKQNETHKEAYFDKGIMSRFDTHYNLLKEFGLIDYRQDQEIKISSLGYRFFNAYKNDDIISIQFIMLNIMINLHSQNPCRNVKNKFRPVPLLASVFIELRKHGIDEIRRDEICLIMSSIDNDYKRVANEIIKFREIKNQDKKREEIRSFLINKLGASEKEMKYDKLFVDVPDSFLRKLRYSGLITTNGYDGIVINEMFEDVLQDIAQLNDKLELPKNKYMEYMSQTHPFIQEKFKNIINIKDVKDYKFDKWINIIEESENDLDSMIINLLGNKKTKMIPDLDMVSSPILLEFFIALKLYKNVKDIKIKPNYIVDQNGLPTFHAPAGKPDIEILNEEGKGIVELTLIIGSKQQLVNELIPITTHLIDFQNREERSDCFCWYISPNIDKRVRLYTEFIKYADNLDIFANNIHESLEIINGVSNIKQLLHNIRKEGEND